MLCVGRNEHVLRDVYAGARALLYRDDGQTIQELIENLLALLSGLLRDSVAYLGVGGQEPVLPICARPPIPPIRAAAANELK